MRGLFFVALRALFRADEIGTGDLGWRDDGALGGDAGDQEESPGRQTHKNEPGPAGFSAMSMHGVERTVASKLGEGDGLNLWANLYRAGKSLRDLGKHDSAYFDQAHANIVFCAPQGMTTAALPPFFCFHLPGRFRSLGPRPRRGDRVVYRT